MTSSYRWLWLALVGVTGCRTMAAPAPGSLPGASGEPAPAVAPLRAFHVCLDPGHPSENNDGRTLSHGLREVAVVWEVALRFQERLQAQGISVTLTKQREGQFVSNRDRALIANATGADLMLRLHADAGGGAGFTVYYPRRQGRAQGAVGPRPEVLRASRQAARVFYPAFAAALRGRLRDNGLRGDEQTLIGSRQGALTGSIFSETPTLLVELAFLTNSHDAAWLKDTRNRERMVAALARGVAAVRDQQAPVAGNGGGHRPRR